MELRRPVASSVAVGPLTSWSTGCYVGRCSTTTLVGVGSLAASSARHPLHSTKPARPTCLTGHWLSSSALRHPSLGRTSDLTDHANDWGCSPDRVRGPPPKVVVVVVMEACSMNCSPFFSLLNIWEYAHHKPGAVMTSTHLSPQKKCLTIHIP